MSDEEFERLLEELRKDPWLSVVIEATIGAPGLIGPAIRRIADAAFKRGKLDR